LVRKRFVSIISEGLAEEDSKETFVNIANGTLEPFDRIVLSSTRLLRYITKAELGRIFASPGTPGIGSELAELQDFIMTEILGRSSVIGVSVAEGAEDGVMEENAPTKSLIPGDLVEKVLAFFKRYTSHIPKISFNVKLPSFKKLYDKVLSFIPAKKPAIESEPAIALPGIAFFKNMTKEKILAGVVILLVVLIGGIFWMRTSGTARRQIAEQQAKLNHVRDLLSEAATTGQFDKAKAADLLIAGEQDTLAVLNSNVLRNDAVKMMDEIQKQRDGLDEIKRIAAPTVLADLTAKRPNVNALGLMNLKDRLFAFEYNALYEIVLDKLQEPLTIDSLETVILGTPYDDKESLLFLTRTGKMIEYISTKFLTVTTKDGIWKKGIDMKSYNSRVYVLDPERNQIWRYTRRNDGFDAGEAYNQDADLKKAVGLAIDSSVYVLNSDGTVIQMYQGQKQEYPLRRAPLVPVSAPTKIFTSGDLNYIYILEPSKARVVIFRKDPKNGGAQYQTQYVFENTGLLRDLLVADGRLYVMDDKKVYFINLNEL
jgi:hypothetical protein